MSSDRELQEWCEDFGSQPLSSTELVALLERARSTSDTELRKVVKEVQMLRWLAPILLERAQSAAGAEDDEVLKLARFIITGEGGLGSK